MARSRLTDVLMTRTLMGDGDPAALLQASGSALPGAATGEWGLVAPELLREACAASCEAGADCLTALGEIPELQRVPFDDLVLQRAIAAVSASVHLAREAGGDQRYVLAAVPSLLVSAAGTAHRVLETVLAAGADALTVREPSAGDFASLRQGAGTRPSLPLIAAFLFHRAGDGPGSAPFRTSSGHTAESIAEAVAAWGADGVEVSAGGGVLPEDLISLVAALRSRTDLPILARLPAGPVEADGGKVSRPDAPEVLAQHAWPLVRSGANLVAGGPGITAEHLRLLRDEIDQL